MKRTILAAGLALALGCSLAACGGDDSSSGGSVEGWCALEGKFDENPFEAVDPTDVDGFRTAIEEFQGSFGELRSSAPEEIKGDVDTVLTAFDGLVDALEEADYDFLKVDPAALESLGGEEINAASERVSEFTDANCS
jgi:ABC-type amino acid transport substrate-binding protein